MAVLLFNTSGTQVGSFTTIQEAVDNASNGFTVEVEPGTYNENVVIDVSITLISTGGRGVTTITGSTGGALGTIEIDPNTNDVTIGDTDQGFTINGFDSASPGVETAAIYIQGDNSGITIRDNEVVANGEAGLLSEFGATVTDVVVDGNTFSGQTFTGNEPAGDGFGDQFTLQNVPRQLVTLGGNGANTSMVTFSNNEVTGTAGGINSSGNEQGNTLVTIDAADSTIEGNSFTGFTNRFATALRAREDNTDIQNNTFDAATSGSDNTTFVFIDTPNPGAFGSNTFISTEGVVTQQSPAGSDEPDVTTGTDGPDNIVGTPADDFLIGGLGDDTITGLEGADTLDGGEDDDQLFGDGPTSFDAARFVALAALAGGESYSTDFDDFGPISFTGAGAMFGADDGWGGNGVSGLSGGSQLDAAFVNEGGDDQALRLSNAVTSGNYDTTWPFAPAIQPAGEEETNDIFAFSVDFASATGALQVGASMDITVGQRGTAVRQGLVRVEDDADDGMSVGYFETLADGTFNFVEIATGLDRTETHTINVQIDFNDGADNDVVTIEFDGDVFTAGSWEGFFRNSSDPAGDTPSVDTIGFRNGDFNNPLASVDGGGFQFDNLTIASYDEAAVAGGDDLLIGGPGADTLDGGFGTDIAQLADNGGAPFEADDFDFAGLTVTDGVVSGTVTGPEGPDTLANIEVLKVANTGSDTFIVLEGMSIQDAVDAAEAGDTVVLSDGTFEESVTVDKALSFEGAGVGSTIIDPGTTPGSGSGFSIEGDLGTDATLSISGITFQNSANGAGIDFDDNAVLGALEITDSFFEANAFNGIRIGGNLDPVDLDSVVIQDSGFRGNGQPQSSSGDGDILFFQYNGDATIENVSITGQNRGSGPAENGIQFRSDTGALGNVTLSDITIDGIYEKQPIAFFNYDNLDGLSASNVVITADSTSFGISGNVDGVGGTIDLSGIDTSAAPDPLALQGDGSANTIIDNPGATILNGDDGADILDSSATGPTAPLIPNDTGDDFVIFENGSADKSEPFAVALVLDDGTNTDYRYEIPDLHSAASTGLQFVTGFDIDDWSIPADSDVVGLRIRSIDGTSEEVDGDGEGFLVSAGNAIEGVTGNSGAANTDTDAADFTIADIPTGNSQFDPDITYAALTQAGGTAVSPFSVGTPLIGSAVILGLTPPTTTFGSGFELDGISVEETIGASLGGSSGQSLELGEGTTDAAIDEIFIGEINSMNGQAGPDTATAGGETDIMTGGSDTDRYEFSLGDGFNLITDFDFSTEVIEISGTGLGIAEILALVTSPFDDLFRITLPDNTTIDIVHDGGQTLTTANFDIAEVPPVAVDDFGSVSEDGPAVTINLTDNDTDGDGDTLSVSSLGTASAGTVTTVGTTSASYAPNTALFQQLAAGQVATDSFSYIVTDGTGRFDTATVTVTITGQNDPPSADDDSATVLEDGPPVAINVLQGDGDIDLGDTLSVASVSPDADGDGVSGAVSVNADGTITYNPDGQFEDLAAGESATDQFTYLVTDGNGGTDVGTVTVTIFGEDEVAPPDGGDGEDGDDDGGDGGETPANTPPVAVSDQVTTSVLAGPIDIGVLDNDTDADNDALTVSAINTAGEPGLIEISGGNTQITFDPTGAFPDLTQGQSRDVVIGYTASDGKGGTDVATVTITVTGSGTPDVTGPPVALNDSFAATGAPIMGNLFDDNGAGADFDPDLDPFSLTGINGQPIAAPVTLPSGAEVTAQASGLFTYDPDPDGDGVGPEADSFTYTITGTDGQDTASVTIGDPGDDPDDDAQPLLGTEGDDVLEVMNFDQPTTVESLGGDDVVQLPIALDDTLITPIPGGGFRFTPVDAEGLATGQPVEVFNTETFVFDAPGDDEDQTLILDTSETAQTLTVIYQVFLARIGDAPGVSYWGGFLQDAILSLDEIADFFPESDEFGESFGEDLTNKEYVEQLYDNSFGRDADTAGCEFWAGLIDLNDETNGEAGLDRGTVGLFFAQSEEIETVFGNFIDQGVLVLA